MDVSGSMGSPFDQYYYDQFGKQITNDKTDKSDSKRKIEVAANSVVALLGHLNSDDRFGMVVFDDQAYLAKPLGLVGNSDMEKIKAHILELSERGGTQMSAGMKMGTELFSELQNADQDEYENRIIFLTDAMPNIGETSESGLLGMLKKNSENKIYTTFIGMGVDFNTELVDYITKIRGANYYSVHSAKEFKQRMDDEFDYMVTPLVFDLALNLDAEGYRIKKVYGSPEANEATGEIMKVNTLFPSKTESGQTKGGIVLLKLKKISQDSKLVLSVSYEDRNGKKTSSIQNINLGEGVEYFENNGIRKGVLLARYADLMKNWINDERMNYDRSFEFKPSVGRELGIIAPPLDSGLGQWERQSMPLRVSGEYRVLFGEFKTYFEKEANSIGDSSLNTEMSVLERLSR
jgi:Ca-activated chloride channel family protein